MAADLGINWRGMRTDDLVNAIHAERGRRMEQDNLLERAKQAAMDALTKKQEEILAEARAIVAESKSKPQPITLGAAPIEPLPAKHKHEPSRMTRSDAFSSPDDASASLMFVPGPESVDDGGGGGGAQSCPLGELVTWVDDPDTKVGISGGVVYAGPNVFAVDRHEINLNVAFDGYAWLEVGITANLEDGVLLPGLSASTTPVWKTGSSYDDQTIPTATDETGTAIIAIGRLVVDVTGGTPGVATLSPAGCGHATVTHCPGSLTISRG